MNARFVLLALSLCVLPILGAEEKNGLDPKIHDDLRQILREGPDTAAKLRALWTLHTTGGLDTRTIRENLKSADEWVRAWTIQLVSENRDDLERLLPRSNEPGRRTDLEINQLAESDPSPVVRLAIAGAAQRVQDEAVRAGLVQRLLAHQEDAKDHNLPLMIWFAMEPLVPAHPAEALALALGTPLPQILNFTTRRIAALGTAPARDLLAERIGALDDVPRQLEMLAGLSAALKGQRSVPMPAGWDAIETKLGDSANPEVRTLAQTLSLTFGSQRALQALRNTLGDRSAPAAARHAALESLVGIKDVELPPVLQALLKDPELRGPALRALAGYKDPHTPEKILEAYPGFDARQKHDALNTLVARPAFAKPLLAAVGAGKIPAKDLTADVVRQLRNLKDADIQSQVSRLYGAVRETSADKKAEIEKYRRIYSAGGSQQGNASPGRLVFNRVCAQCHTLFDTGGKVGPDITGANRSDLNYLLETIIDPNAVIPNEYRTTEIETKDGRSLAGIVRQRDDRKLVLQTANELLTIPMNEIASQRLTELSMMPEGLLAPLTDQEVRDLIYYLTRLGQVPLPPESGAK